jgi:hypothetical protein
LGNGWNLGGFGFAAFAVLAIARTTPGNAAPATAPRRKNERRLIAFSLIDVFSSGRTGSRRGIGPPLGRPFPAPVC